MAAKPTKKDGESPLSSTEAQISSTEAQIIAGLPFDSEKAATILGLKITGQWTRTSYRSLAAQWGITGEAVSQLAAKIDAGLQQLHDKQPARRLVVHQLLLALRELNNVTDHAKRIALRVKVASELAKVTGLVKSTVLQMGGGGLPPPLTDDALKGSP